MTDRTDLFEAALDSLPDGIALAGLQGEVAFWSRAAEEMTGHARADLVGRPVRDILEKLIVGGARRWVNETGWETRPGHGSLVHVHHRLGHDFPVKVRTIVMRDGLGTRIGLCVVFHLAEAFSRGECGESAAVRASHADMRDRLEAEFHDLALHGLPFGVLWITVDQAHELRKTHGAGACDAMLEKVEHALVNGLRPDEVVGRWGDDEFLVISHERAAEMLASHAQALAGLVRTVDFRWWGDRIALTVSIGEAQADEAGTLADLLARAQAATLGSIHAVTRHGSRAPGENSCLPS